MTVDVHHGDSREVLKTFADASIDGCVSDPPYALVSIVKRFGKSNAAPAKGGVYARASGGFMGQQWDTGQTAFDPDFWREVFRVLKPGAHVIAFGGTRTYHRLACAIEDAGFEIRDSIFDLVATDAHVAPFIDSLNEAQLGAFAKAIEESQFGGLLGWLYGSGFPKSHNVAKGVDRTLGEAGTVVPRGDPVRRIRPGADQHKGETWEKLDDRVYQPGSYAPASAQAAAWDGWGTAMKPALEPIVFARKPLIGTIAANVMAHGTGALNIDACRIPIEDAGGSWGDGRRPGGFGDVGADGGDSAPNGQRHELGRWPANVVHDGSPEVIEAFPAEAGAFAPVMGTEPSNAVSHVYNQRERKATHHHGDNGSASRFFYTAKADAEDRLGSKHPTVKPIDLMAWLCRLVIPPGGTVLDPFAGTGTTGLAAMGAGFNAVLIEQQAEYVADIHRRLAWARGEGRPTFQEKRRPKDVEEPTHGFFAALGDAE